MLNGKISSILNRVWKSTLLTLCLVAALSVPCMADEASVIISTDYPGVSAKPGASVSFPLYIVNNSAVEEDASLRAEGLPEGWSGYFRGSDSEVSSVHIRAEQKKEDSPKLSYSVTIPEDAEDGDYTFTVQADGNDTAAVTKMTVTVTSQEAGQSNFTAQYPEQQGDTSTKFSFDTTIINNRLTPQSYALAARAPEGWTVTFTPAGESSKVASLPVDPDKSQGLTVDVTPSETAQQGDYVIPLAAVSSDDALELELQVTITGTYDVMTFDAADQNVILFEEGSNTLKYAASDDRLGACRAYFVVDPTAVGDGQTGARLTDYIINLGSLGSLEGSFIQRGDANGDGNISVTDIAVVVNCILQLDNNGGFSEYGADANGDGQVTVTDIGVIVDKILGVNNSSAASRRLQQEVEPQ